MYQEKSGIPVGQSRRDAVVFQRGNLLEASSSVTRLGEFSPFEGKCPKLNIFLSKL
jgi:predicted transcriptional regulator